MERTSCAERKIFVSDKWVTKKRGKTVDNQLFYELGDSLYVNVTNRCTNRCTFCIRDHGNVGGYDLWLQKEPSLEEMCKAMDNIDWKRYREVVFCGYGEPLMRLEEVVAMAAEIKKRSALPVRVNTNGHANAIYGKDITPKLEGIDTLSISLNAKDEVQYDEICKPAFEGAFETVKQFARLSKNHVKEVILSVVDTIISPEDIEKCQKIAEEIGVPLRVRHYEG